MLCLLVILSTLQITSGASPRLAVASGNHRWWKIRVSRASGVHQRFPTQTIWLTIDIFYVYILTMNKPIDDIDDYYLNMMWKLQLVYRCEWQAYLKGTFNGWMTVETENGIVEIVEHHYGTSTFILYRWYILIARYAFSHGCHRSPKCIDINFSLLTVLKSRLNSKYLFLNIALSWCRNRQIVFFGRKWEHFKCLYYFYHYVWWFIS